MQDLHSVDWQNIDDIPNQGKWIEAKICKVIDGDTYIAIYSFGSKIFKIRLRLSNADTPETSRSSDLEEEAGTKVTQYLQELIENKI